ncbi:single-strand DNA endonuclease ASTE1 [Parasteatoda tepidariorum]|uniref:single-strand DNA endonuclease ASTE1 n=1 Tax=Parasteatoda tepidariorum TaxID=114398 RepID=UPI001C7239A2|nr:protein asteroid homolog 1 [Parasteatoda tepidariorum]
MGVRGLTSFIEAHPELTKPYRLHDCTVVIDGNNLIHFLYSFYKINCAYGGDYNTFATKSKSYFSTFKECNVKPVVVIDGGLDKSDLTFPNQMERWKDRIIRVEQASATGKSTHPFLPTNAIEDFKNILSNLDIPFTQCEYDSDAQIAALANHFNCPVLSDDGDFFIFDVISGYIKLSSFSNFLVQTLEDKITKYFTCKIYHLSTFLSHYPLVDKSTLPLLACIAGNDYFKFNKIKAIAQHVYPVQGQKIPQILKWLSNRNYNEAVEQLLHYIHTESREKFRILLEHSANSYRVENFDLSYLFEKNSPSCATKSILHSKLVTPCGTPFPNEYILNHIRGNIPSYFLNVMNLHRIFHSPQVGDLHEHGSSKCSRFVRRVLYGVLFQHETSNFEYHELVCLRDVCEYDTYKGMEVCFKIKPLFVLPSGKTVPKLYEIKLMSKTDRLEILAEVMGVKKVYLRTILPNWQLLFGVIKYWLQHCSPKPTKEFLVALLLSLIYFNVLLKPNLKINNVKENAFDDLKRIYSLLDKITPSESLSAVTNLEKYACLRILNGRFDVSVIQNYNQLQSCLAYAISLNKLLASPLKSPNISEIFEGTMLHNLTKKLTAVRDSKSFIKSLLGDRTPCYKIFILLLEKVLQNVSNDFPWEKTVRKVESSKIRTSKVVLTLKNDISVSNKFECLNISVD